MQYIKCSIRDASTWFLPCVKSSWTTLLPLMIVTAGFHEYFSWVMRVSPMNNQIMLLSSLGKLLNGFLEGGILILLLPLRCHEIYRKLPFASWLGFAGKHFWPLFIESIRSLTSVIIWFLGFGALGALISYATFSLSPQTLESLLIQFPGITQVQIIGAVIAMFAVPSMFRYTRLNLVPYVVYFSPQYHDGKVDALKESNQLVKGSTGWVLFVMVMGGVLYYLSIEGLDKLQLDEFSRILALIVVKIFNLSISVFTYGIFYSIYKQSTDRPQQSKESSQ